MKRSRWLVPLVLSAVAATGYFFSSAIFSPLPDWLGGEKEIAVRTAPVRRSSMPVIVRVTGELAPARETNIISRLVGKVTAVRFNVGDSVTAGAEVATIYSGALAQRATELQATVNAARKDADVKKQLVADAEERLAKSRELYQKDLIARRDVLQAETVMETARAQAELARANLAQQEAMRAQVRALQSLTRLSAPVGGVVTRRWVEPGAAIAESGPVLTIANLRTLKIIANVSGAHSRDVRDGMKVEISSLEAPGMISQGKVMRVESRKAAEEPIAHVEIHVDNTKGIFRPGMTARALIPLEQREDALLLPRSAVVAAQGRDHVYKLAGNRAMRQEITLGNQRDEEIEVKNGLKEGDLVVVDRLNLLETGRSVRVLPAPTQPTAGK